MLILRTQNGWEIMHPILIVMSTSTICILESAKTKAELSLLRSITRIAPRPRPTPSASSRPPSPTRMRLQVRVRRRAGSGGRCSRQRACPPTWVQSINLIMLDLVCLAAATT